MSRSCSHMIAPASGALSVFEPTLRAAPNVGTAHPDGVGAAPWRTLGRDGPGVAWLRTAEMALLSELQIRGGERALFVECGDGWAAEEARRRMAKGYVCGVDRSARFVGRATRLRGVPGKLEFATWDGRRLPYLDGCFDSVVLQRDVRYWLRRVSVLRETHRIVRYGGVVYLFDLRPTPGAASEDAPPEWRLRFERAGLLLHGVRVPAVGTKDDAENDCPAARILRAPLAGGE